MVALLGRQITDLDTKITEIDARLTAMHKANEVSQRLATIPGVGPITALTLALAVDPEAFESGRHFAASAILILIFIGWQWVNLISNGPSAGVCGW
jgi:transposase